MQQEIAKKTPDLTPYDVQKYIEESDPADLPLVPMQYQLSQICVYPDRDAANIAVKERLLAIRERIINGEKFSTLARIYSQDPGSARKGGELGMASKSIFWPVFSDAAMALKPGVVSQIVETPDGFHIIEVLEKKGDMFNARHILLKPEYTSEDRNKAFKTLDSLKVELQNEAVTFDLAAKFYSEDPATRTNGGQMADPQTGSSYFEIDQLKPQDYAAIKDLKEGEISDSIESLDNEGRDGNTVYKIIKVDKIIPSHPASFTNDYTLLLNQAKQKLQMEAIDGFIDSKIRSTYIIIDPMFEDCVFERDGWYEKFRKAE
jgi:peptidyl-prolyl cis-trans isomerase SurA